MPEDPTFTSNSQGSNLRNEVYGAGVAIDTKANLPPGPFGRKLSHRFRASTTSDLLSVSWERRTGPGYSAGDGGTMRITVRPDDGNGKPSNTILASVDRSHP